MAKQKHKNQWQFTVLVSYDEAAKHNKVPVMIVAEADNITVAIQEIEKAHPRLLDRGFSVVRSATAGSTTPS
jgi:hypothetical protein